MSDIALPTRPSRGGLSTEMVLEQFLSGETFTAGMTIELGSTSKWVKADRDTYSGGPLFIALNTVTAAGQPVSAVAAGFVSGFSGLTPGTQLYLSDTAGRLCPLADIPAGEPVVPVATAVLADTIRVIAVPLPGAEPGVVAVTAQRVGPLADQGANATVSVKFGSPPTGRQWALRRLQVLSGTTADATAQVKIDGDAAHDAAALDGDTEVTAFATIGAAAAGEAVTVALVTAASTGDLDAAVLLLEYYDLPA